MKKRHVKIAILGAGTAGLSAQKIIAKYTEDYVVIDKGQFGTMCARVACMPSKALIQVAKFRHEHNTHYPDLMSNREKIIFDDAQVMQHVRKLRDGFVASVIDDMKTWRKNHLIEERANFIDEHTLRVGDEYVEAEKIIVAIGSTTLIPKEWLGFSDYLLSNETFFEQVQLPKSVAVIGVGPVGLELGQALHNLGVEIYMIGKGQQIAGMTDPKLNAYAIEHLQKEYQLDFSAVKNLDVKNQSICVQSGERTYTVEKVLLAMGRKSNAANLAWHKLDQAFELGELPSIDQKTLQVQGHPHIWVVGDANNSKAILHESADEGRWSAQHALEIHTQPAMQRKPALSIVFSQPNCASVGHSFQTLQEQGIPVKIGVAYYDDQGRAKINQENVGMIRLYFSDDQHESLLGGELFAPQAEHLAHLLAWAINKQMTRKELLSMPYYHLTLEEGLKTAVNNIQSKGQ